MFVCQCAYVRIYDCMCVSMCVSVRTCKCIYVFICRCAYICIYACVHLFMCVRTFVYMYVRTFVYMCVRTFVYMCVCIIVFLVAVCMLFLYVTEHFSTCWLSCLSEASYDTVRPPRLPQLHPRKCRRHYRSGEAQLS